MPIAGIPTYAEVREAAISVYKSLRPDASVAEGSDVDIKATTDAHLVHGLHMTLWYGLLYNMLPTKSSGWVLDTWLWLFGMSDGSGGFGRIKARGSSGTDAFTFVAGTGPYSDLKGEIFVDAAGSRYQINENYTPTGAGTTPALDVIAVTWPTDNGAATNIEVLAGETFEWESQPSYMDSTITQVADLDGGANKETDAEGRARLARRLQTPPMGGNWAHWENVAEESSPGNIDAWVWEGLHDDTHGFGNTDIACTQRGEGITDPTGKELESTDDLYDVVAAALEAALPLGTLFRHRFLDSNADAQDVVLTITLNSNATEAQKCDWDAESIKTTISSFSESNKTITCNDNIHTLISVDDRVMIYSAQAIVTKVGTADGLADNATFEVQEWFDVADDETNPFPWYDGFTPSTEYVYSGGGLVLECVRALRETTFQRLGPYKGTAGNAAPVPGWEDTLRIQQIQSDLIAVGDAAGEAAIVDVDVTTPASDTIPNTGSDTDVFFLAPDEIVIWEVK